MAMNVVLLKGLIISGGTIGLGVPSIYYGYPYISNLINPGAEEDQKSSGKPKESSSTSPVSIAKNEETATDTQKTINSPDNSNGNDAESGSRREGDNKDSKAGKQESSSSGTPTSSAQQVTGQEGISQAGKSK